MPASYANATVVRVDGETAWVRFDGGVPETPCHAATSCKPGDRVLVAVAHHRAVVVASLVGLGGRRSESRPTNCPNCDAVLSYEGGLHCDYCGARFEEPGQDVSIDVRADFDTKTAAEALSRLATIMKPSPARRH